jgi:prophage tail gpP-like protein
MILKINDRIRNRKVEFFNSFNISLRYDSIASTFSFNFLFNPENKEHKEMACLSHYHLATLEHNGELLLTGYILSQVFNNSSKKEMCGFAGYSLPGVLEDCEIPPSLYPLQSDNLSLSEIASKLIQPFKLKMVVDPAVSSKMNAVFEKTTAKETQTIKSYLTELAAQKNILVSHNEKGELLFTQAKTKQNPILNFEDGGVPFTKMTLSFNGQAMHSDITVIKQADSDGGNAGEATIKNPYVPFVFRPKVVTQNSGDDNDTEQAAKNILAAELKNLTLTIVTDRWELDGKMLKPNNIISVLNPEVYIYKKTNWFIEQIDYTGDQEKTVATLKCVLPEVYNGGTPKSIVEGINLH